MKARPAAAEDESDVDYLVCDDPEMVRHMVSYFYGYTYSCGNTNTSDDSTASSPQAEILTHAKMFALAIKYQVDGLREYAAKCFRYAVHVAWDSNEFLKVLDLVLTSTPEEVRELRDVVFDTIYEHFIDLKRKDGIREAFRNHPDLSFHLLERKWDKWSYETQSVTMEEQCPVCHQYTDESQFAPGLPKMCRKCDSGDWSGW